MMLTPVARELPRRREPTAHDPFIDAFTPSQKHAARRCESVRPPAVVAVDVYPLEMGRCCDRRDVSARFYARDYREDR